MTFALIILTIAGVAKADVFQCNFGEDGGMTYSSTTETLTVTTYDDNNGGKPINKTTSGVSLQIKSAGTFLLMDRSHAILATLVLDHQGSDGNSDVIYPYSVTPAKSVIDTIGGCSSNFIHQAGHQ